MVQATENLLGRIKISENKSAATFKTDTIFAQASDDNSCFYLNTVGLFLYFVKKVTARRLSNRKTSCIDWFKNRVYFSKIFEVTLVEKNCQN